ncbi:MAG: 23S rRNA (uracil(1939)-C(5))-methyltransferase RlmD [Elusimicrobiota bacterium]|nr:23S rRNA (uracil(1939)-C(5))-methyltransferase RlmD [Elusimicrobiota bacterium]
MSLKNQIVSVEVEKIVFPGRSLCRCQDGIALFTDGLLPGEKAFVLVIKDKKTFREGIVKEIVEKSPDRIEPVCSLFNKCGGCSFQNTDYANQIKLKYAYVSELLKSVEIELSEIFKSPEIWKYRNKMEFSFFDNEGNADLGLHCKGSFNKYISVRNCLICGDLFMQAASLAREIANEKRLCAYDNKSHKGFLRHLVLREAKNNNQFLVNISTSPIDLSVTDGINENSFISELGDKLKSFSDGIFWTKNGYKSDAVIIENISLIRGSNSIEEKLNVNGKDYFFKISPSSFFQTNSKGAELLYNTALKLLDPQKTDTILDLYCGTGTISISISKEVKKVVGIEINQRAVEDAKSNAALNEISNVDFIAGSAQEWVKNVKENFDAIILDPPRSGLTNEVIKFLLENLSPKIIYISCNPSTLVRDLTLLKNSGKYEIKSVVAIDLFPQTYHIETAVLLKSV